VVLGCYSLKEEPIAKFKKDVSPAKAGVQKYLKRLDSRFRGNDNLGLLLVPQNNIKEDDTCWADLSMK
jgi:hypothetical protein